MDNQPARLLPDNDPMTTLHELRGNRRGRGLLVTERVAACSLLLLLSRGEHSTSLPGQLGARRLVQYPGEDDGDGVTG